MTKEKHTKKKEYDQRQKRVRRKWNLTRDILISLLLLAALVIGLFLVRPTRSLIEKRELAQLPKLTWSSLWDGSYFTGLSDWYTDTYPLRENMMTVDSAVEKAYGLQKDEFHGDASVRGDEIPDVEDASSAPIITGNVPQENAPTETTESAAVQPDHTTEEEPTEEASREATEERTEASVPDGTITEEPEAAGNIYITDGRGFNVFYFDRSIADYYASMVNTLRARIPGKVNFYEMLVPTAFGVCLSDEVQKDLGGSNEGDALRYIYSLISDDVVKVDVFNTLKQHNSEYLYFGTDHHWTALGAWYAYSEWCLKRGIEQHTLDQFEKVEYDDFLGTFYAASGKSNSLKNHPDTVEAYIPMGTNNMVFYDETGKEIPWKVILDVTDYDSSLKYCTFIGADNQLSIIENPEITNGSAVLLLKESYGNAFAPFLVDHYQNTIVVDYRYYKGSVKSLIDQYHVTDVILLNNMEALTTGHCNELLSIFPE